MEKREREQYRMFKRGGEFGALYAARFSAGSAGQKAFTELASAAAECDRAEGDRSAMREGGHGMTRATRRTLLAQMASITRTARGMAEDTPGADSKFQPPAKRAD